MDHGSPLEPRGVPQKELFEICPRSNLNKLVRLSLSIKYIHSRIAFMRMNPLQPVNSHVIIIIHDVNSGRQYTMSTVILFLLNEVIGMSSINASIEYR